MEKIQSETQGIWRDEYLRLFLLTVFLSGANIIYFRWLGATETNSFLVILFYGATILSLRRAYKIWTERAH